MRGKHLDYKTDRKTADEILREMCVEDGMSTIRANYVYDGVRLAGLSAARPRKEPEDKIICVP
jgi:hypothetical protein